MAKKMSPQAIGNLMAGAVMKKYAPKAGPAEGSPAEEAQESGAEGAAEGDAPKKKMSGKQVAAMKSKGKS